MIISGTGIISSLTVKVLPSFTPEFMLALKWNQLASGNWYAVDRGASADYYASNIMLYGKEDVINTFIDAVEANRVQNSNVLYLSNFSITEHIFGADLDYSGTINATVDTRQAMRRTQNSWRGWGLSLRVVALSPLPFKSVSPALPIFRNINIGVDADSDRTLDKEFTYDNIASYDDHVSDYGTFVGDFIFTDTDMAAFRKFMRTNRGADVTIPKLNGIRYPFGRRSTEYPTNFPVKIIKWEDEKMRDITRWDVKLTLAEVI
jgi:hypothetical protein